ncbi:MAG: hypothetical protein O7F16_02095 [Acidobacteria bacterium]|nr:hypothetical protein [Acidobacteriota bacterium]
MKRILIVLTILTGLSAPSYAGKLEKALKHRWLGAWAVTTVETHSDCSGSYTKNRINGRFVNSSGRHRFRPGELAKVVKVDARRSRLDLFLRVNEPLLVPRHEGPFTLYDQVYCEFELEVVLPRELVKSKDVAGIERSLRPILERHATEDEARSTRAYNQRVRRSYPDDYEETLAEHAIWEAEQANAAVQAKIDVTLDVTAGITSRMSSDYSYLTSFAKGVEVGKLVSLNSCQSMMAAKLGKPHSSRTTRSSVVNAAVANSRAYIDGRNLVLALELMRRLPDCFVPIPVVEAAPVAHR